MSQAVFLFYFFSSRETFRNFILEEKLYIYSDLSKTLEFTVSPSSILSLVMHLFQSFTEGELKQVIRTLVQRKAQRDAKLGKRTKRAKKGTKPCSLTDKEVTVSQLGLGYVSDEVILFRYCSGKCVASRRNYDLALAKLKGQRLLTRENVDRARHSPCCRPTAYEEITFLDNHSHYHTIHEVSALKCACV